MPERKLQYKEELFSTEDPFFTPFEIQMGPQHPSTHGVLKLRLVLEGERIVDCEPEIGFLHRGLEKLAESMSYTQVLPLTDRLDYISAMNNNTGYALAVERLLGIEPPPRGKFLRTMVCELARVASHLLWLATHALDIGAMTVFLYCFREREKILDFFEDICGARLTVSYPKIGGVRLDVEMGTLERIYDFLPEMEKRLEEYEGLLSENRIWLERTRGVGVISAEEAIAYGLTGPSLRGSGVEYDVRKHFPYDAYPDLDFEVPIGKNGDIYDRYLCRLKEMRQSLRIVKQCIEKMPSGPVCAENSPDLDMLISKRAPVAMAKGEIAFIGFPFERVNLVPFGELYSAVEGAKGELGFYIVSDGTGKPYRLHIRAPSFVHISALPKLAKGHFLADLVSIIGTLDIVMGECDR
ncbi:MAG: NADH-quinone oxidoreductase subunit D [Caldimicrobium sp.]|nr:NADH-quinone oxidoreductase subunit D [Caldimicrobium sp.]MDW8182309.1 NADH-quinone oxidoreductase subunit D [Caldimicrobium sp.]